MINEQVFQIILLLLGGIITIVGGVVTWGVIAGVKMLPKLLELLFEVKSLRESMSELKTMVKDYPRTKDGLKYLYERVKTLEEK